MSSNFANSTHNVLNGVSFDFSQLNEKDRNKLLKLFARVSESSYRRGLQQGRVMEQRGWFHKDPGEWRYAASLDRAPLGELGRNAKWQPSSVWRLETEGATEKLARALKR